MKRARVAALAVVLALVPIAALAQRFDPKRPANFTVGAPRGPVATDRLDAHRTGASQLPLPTTHLKALWRHSLGELITQPPLVVGSEVIVLAGRGEMVFIDSDVGDEVARVSIGASSSGPATALSSGTVVVVTSSGDAVGVRKEGVAFRTHLGGEISLLGRVSPLSLDDGGAVVASATELDVLDSHGGIRARATIPDELDGALLAARGRVLAVTESGVVYAWTPGKDPERVGSFGGRAFGGATLDGDHTLLAVIEGSRVMALDLDRGIAVPRNTSNGLLYIGPVSVRGDNAFLLAKGPGRTLLIGIDRAGTESTHLPIVQGQIPLLIDGGAAPPSLGGHAPLVVDKSQAVAYGIEDEIGVVDAQGNVSKLGGSLCRSHSSDILGIAPTSEGFVVACEDGAVALVGGKN
ncbi:MAG: PQQ-binding-like beta-propeller repeat protein [Polyangiaceae bacterium]